jgi:uncharacterized membrane protein
LKTETRLRSVAKTASYRVLVIAILAVVTYAFTGDVGETTTITVVFNVAGTVAYYVYERLWDAINWGKMGGMPARGRSSLVRGTEIPHPSEDASSPKLQSRD